jgi:hypothetical protein
MPQNQKSAAGNPNHRRAKQNASEVACELVSSSRTADAQNKNLLLVLALGPDLGAEKSGESGRLSGVTGVGRRSNIVAESSSHVLLGN